MQVANDAGVELPPPYSSTCDCPGCRAQATHTVVLNLWAVDDLKPFRGEHNAVRLYPAVVSCDKHKVMLHEIGFQMLKKAFGHARTIFQKLSKEPPDMADTLIDVRTIAEAMKLWHIPTKR